VVLDSPRVRVAEWARLQSGVRNVDRNAHDDDNALDAGAKGAEGTHQESRASVPPD